MSHTSDSTELYGEFYQDTLAKVSNIIKTQHVENIDEGIKGFLFHGEPGIGKTTTARRIVKDLNAHLSFQDCADLAMARYGDTETKIREVFDEENISRGAGKRDITVYVFDDAEGLFITRDLPNIEAWYIGHINVLFHEMDQLDTSRQIVIMTTNRKDLLDKALIDRLYPIKFETPAKDVLIEAARKKAQNFQIFSESDISHLETRIREDDSVETFRDVERIVTEEFVELAAGDSI
jgi:transitional endoplasmic reticulum ATPase